MADRARASHEPASDEPATKCESRTDTWVPLPHIHTQCLFVCFDRRPRFGPTSANLGRIWPDLGQILWLRPECDQFGLDTGHLWPSQAQFQPSLAEIGQILDRFARIRTKFAELWRMWPEAGRFGAEVGLLFVLLLSRSLNRVRPAGVPSSIGPAWLSSSSSGIWLSCFVRFHETLMVDLWLTSAKFGPTLASIVKHWLSSKPISPNLADICSAKIGRTRAKARAPEQLWSNFGATFGQLSSSQISPSSPRMTSRGYVASWQLSCHTSLPQSASLVPPTSRGVPPLPRGRPQRRLHGHLRGAGAP